MRLHHLSLLLFLGLLGGFAAHAARAPDPRSWVDGWKVEDPEKRAKFERKGDVLTIIMFGKEEGGEASSILREVSGDFVAEVRVSGNFIPSEGLKDSIQGVMAGLCLWGEKQRLALVYRVTYRKDNALVTALCSEGNENRRKFQEVHLEQWSSDLEVYMRLSRKGKNLLAAFSADGKKWHEAKPGKPSLPTKLMLGVFTNSNSAAPFKPRFDRFRLTLAGPKGP